MLAAQEAVNETERRLCGSAAVSRPSVAEGLALQGQRAATLLAPVSAGQLGSDTASVRVAWVHHRTGFGTATGFAFELAASVVQDAIDHCLVAHDLARRLGAPGLCTLAASSTLDRAILPDEALVHEFDSAAVSEVFAGTDESLLTETDESFRRVSQWSGRPVSAVTTEGPDDAAYVIVASGASRAPAQRLVRFLESDGVVCRLVCFHLVRPFPMNAMRRALAGAVKALWIAPDHVLVGAARELLSDAVILESSEAESLIEVARHALALDRRSEPSTGKAFDSIVLTARPAGRWGEMLLLDAADRLAGIDGIPLALRDDMLIAGRAPTEPTAEIRIGLAVCAHPCFIESDALLERMAEHGTLMIVSAGAVPDRWWAGLGRETRETLMGRELRIQWLDLSATPHLDLSDPGAVRRVVLDAVAAVTSSSLAGTTPESLTLLDTASLDAACEPGGDGASNRPPRMDSPTPDEEADWRDATRRFHLTGEGAHSGIEPMLAEPLHPFVLDAIEPEPSMATLEFDETALLGLHAAAVRGVRRRHWEPIRDEIVSLAQRLEERIALDEDRAPENLSAETLKSSLGTNAGKFLDPERIAASLRRQRGSTRLGEARRSRIEHALVMLRRALDDDVEHDLILVRPDPAPVCDTLPGVREIVHPRGSGAAIGLFDGLATRYVETFRALRVARLEVDDAYDPDLHDEPLARLEWQGLGENELLSLPRLAVLETDARLRGAGLGAFAELLRSGRPVHVLVEQSTSEFRAAESWQGLAGFHPGLGYVAMAHREAFVIEGSLVRPERLAPDLLRMANSLRPGAAIVAIPDGQATVGPALQLLAIEQSRAIPCFTYDPEAGSHWAERFDLAGNPQPHRPWPLHTLAYLDAAGGQAELEQAFTFAHALALDPAYRRHFRILPDRAWSAEQVELGEYLAAPIASVARKIPFIWVVHDGRLTRAVITRELAYASRDRMRAWHILQELAGTDNEYARRAAESARIDVTTQAEIRGKVLERGHTAEIERARSEAVRQAMDRLARRLVGVEAVPSAIDPQAVVKPPVTTGNGESTEAAQAAEEPAGVVEDPYIDTALCTSCADCININPRLFKYDENKQAFIADAQAGTYAQLVKAAEKCPARCIHPGLPFAGDKTADDRLVARAAKFN